MWKSFCGYTAVSFVYGVLEFRKKNAIKKLQLTADDNTTQKCNKTRRSGPELLDGPLPSWSSKASLCRAPVERGHS